MYISHGRIRFVLIADDVRTSGGAHMMKKIQRGERVMTFQGKQKALTFSYDDGVRQDIRLIGILNRYGLKGTFNLNSGLFGRNGTRICREDIRSVYEGHEVAVHTVTHPFLEELSDDRVIEEVEQDRLVLSDMVGYEVVGMAYPYGYQEKERCTADLIRSNTGVRYARTTNQTCSFALPQNLHLLHPSVFHCNWNELFRLGRDFLECKPDQAQLFYVWGHAYELDKGNGWEQFEEFCRMMSGKDDIYYGTNREILLP